MAWRILVSVLGLLGCLAAPAAAQLAPVPQIQAPVGLTPGTGTAAPVREPLRMTDNPDFFRRILTLPGAQLRRSPSPTAAVVDASVKVFSILYVFQQATEAGTTWLEVGPRTRAEGTAWITADKTHPWDIMLVMQPTPAGQRSRTLYFKQPGDLATLVRDPGAAGKARDLLAQVDGQSHDRARIEAAERPFPEGTVDVNRNPYVMPILGFRKEEFDNGSITTLVNVASINARPAPPAQPQPQPQAQPQPAAPDPRDHKIGITFVIDTTKTMGPYIQRARDTVRNISEALERKGLADRTAFALIGYRNSIKRTPALQYDVKIFQKLDPSAKPQEVLRNLDQVQETSVSTHSWFEDAVAGLTVAIKDQDWAPFKTRLIFLITDTGTLEDGDPDAKFPQVGLVTVRSMARDRSIAILPLHLLSAASDGAGVTPHAREQWNELSQTGDLGSNKYLPIPAGSVDRFEREMKSLETNLVDAIERMSGGTPPPPPPPAPPPASEEPALGNLVVNEIFRSNVDYIGSLRGNQAPSFFSGWAADKDLTNPRRPALEVKVFLTKTQLSGLAQSLKGVVDAAKASQLSPEGFFNQLRALAAATAQDPGAAGSRFESIVESNLLPSYLKLLPYRSDALAMTEQRFRDMNITEQQRFISRLESKLQAYDEIDKLPPDRWMELGANDPAQRVYPVAMSLLP